MRGEDRHTVSRLGPPCTADSGDVVVTSSGATRHWVTSFRAVVFIIYVNIRVDNSERWCMQDISAIACDGGSVAVDSTGGTATESIKLLEPWDSKTDLCKPVVFQEPVMRL